METIEELRQLRQLRMTPTGPALVSAQNGPHFRTIQVGPAWIGRTVAALMLRLFTRRGCQKPAHNHDMNYRKGAYLAERTRERLDYWQFIELRAKQQEEQQEEQYVPSH